MAAKRDITQNRRAEEALLGCLLRSPQDFWKVQDTLKVEHFTVSAHRDLYAVIADIATTGKKISMPLLVSRLPDELEGNSTTAVIAALMHNAVDLSADDFADQVADAAARRRLRSIAAFIDKRALDFDVAASAAAMEAEAAIVDMLYESIVRRPRSIGELSTEIMRTSFASKKSGILPGMNSGLNAWDEIVGQMMPGDYGALIASQGDGKTALAAQIAYHCASASRQTLFYQYEMRAEAQATRELAFHAQTSARKIVEGELKFDEMDWLRNAVAQMQKTTLFIQDDPRLPIEGLRAQALAHKRKHGELTMIVADHARKIPSKQRTKDKWERGELISGEAKNIAKELECIFLMLVQRTRRAQRDDDYMPKVDDAENPAIEQDADWIVGLAREENWLRRNKPKGGGEAMDAWEGKIRKAGGTADIIGLKRRTGRPFETRKIGWNGERTRFHDLGEVVSSNAINYGSDSAPL